MSTMIEKSNNKLNHVDNCTKCNWSNTPSKRQRFADCIKKLDPTLCCLQNITKQTKKLL